VDPSVQKRSRSLVSGMRHRDERRSAESGGNCPRRGGGTSYRDLIVGCKGKIPKKTLTGVEEKKTSINKA